MTALELLEKLVADMRQVKYNAQTQLRNSRNADEIQTLRAQIAITDAYLEKIRELKNQLM